MEFSVKDKLRQLVESESGGKNTILYDDFDNPMIMVWIPKFDRSDLGWIYDGTHPAFIIDDGREIDGFWISKYPNTIANGVAIQRDMSEPAKLLFEDARKACSKKGKGWHLCTGLEWAAIALFSYRYTQGAKTKHQYLGDLNPIADMSHDRTPYGFMFNSTDWEHVDGVRIGPGFEDIYTWMSPTKPEVQNRFWENKYTKTCGSYDYTPYKEDGYMVINSISGSDNNASNRYSLPEGMTIPVEFNDIRIWNEVGDHKIGAPRIPTPDEIIPFRDLALAPALGHVKANNTDTFNGRCAFCHVDGSTTYTFGRGAGWQETQERGGSMFSYYTIPATRLLFFRAAYIPID